MTRDTVWQDDPPFAVGEAQIEEWEAEMDRLSDDARSHYYNWVREQTIRELRNNYKCGEEYEAGLWSRRNIEAFFRDQEGKS